MNQFNLLNMLNTFVDTAFKLQQNAVPKSTTLDGQTSTTGANILLSSSTNSQTQNSPQNLQQVMQENSAAIKEYQTP